MAAKSIPPILGALSFSCPHCGAQAHQTWFNVLADQADKDNPPKLMTADFVEKVRQNKDLEGPAKQDLVDHFERELAGEVLFDKSEKYVDWLMVNVWASQCFSCSKIAIWRAGGVLYPTTNSSLSPSEDLPAAPRADFLEAATIVDNSPRGAAALLRLCIQKLMKAVGQKGENINDDIGALVKAGLDDRMRKALDIVRVVGNNAVHPGQIDLRDDKATALELFSLANVITEALITVPKNIDAMYETLPLNAREAIAKRDEKQ